MKIFLLIIMSSLFLGCVTTAEKNNQHARGAVNSSTGNVPLASQNQPVNKTATSIAPRKNPPSVGLPSIIPPPGLMVASDAVPQLVEDMRYATANNFMGEVLYTKEVLGVPNKCYLLKQTAIGLAKAQALLSNMHPGYQLKVWDCYRPLSVQRKMSERISNSNYVADPERAKHPRGVAVDLTIVDSAGNELAMPTGFDDFTSKAGAHSKADTREQESNRALLQKIMAQAGFSELSSEWWHFDLRQ